MRELGNGLHGAVSVFQGCGAYPGMLVVFRAPTLPQANFHGLARLQPRKAPKLSPEPFAGLRIPVSHPVAQDMGG
ncbi:hypothetical protein D3C85_1427380 [compost metagenome]